MSGCDIYFVGYDNARTDRVWGYLLEDLNDQTAPWNRKYHTFWGSRKGKIYFQGAKNFNSVKGNYREKMKKYTRDDTLKDKVLADFGQLLLVRKLKYGY